MKQLSKVVWSEGMYLGPHHFQAQASFFENSVHFTANAMRFEPWGYLGFELDAEALRNGTVSLVHARGVFPDGLLFQMPESDTLPAPRHISEVFPPTRDRLNLYLAAPRRKPGGANCSLANGDSPAGVRYIANERPFTDEVTGADEKPVRIGRKNIRLLLDIDSLEEYEVLPLARILRDGAGGFVYDGAFVPPCLRISASERLMAITRRLVEILQTKGGAVMASVRGKAWLQSGLSPQQVTTFWFLHAINSALAPINHLYLSKQGHPEELFLEMLRLGGALCTFGLESSARSLPLYDHRNPEECFENLDRHIRAHLELIIPSSSVLIRLDPAANRYFWEGEVRDPRCLGASRWIFGIRANLGEAELIMQTPRLAKLCSSAFVPELVRRALPGMTLTHLPTPPAAISPRVDTQYFVVSKAGPCWEHILQTKRVGVYVPGEIPNPELELQIVLES